MQSFTILLLDGTSSAVQVGNRIYFFNSSPFEYFSYYDIDTKLCQADETWETLENLSGHRLVKVHRVYGNHEIGGMSNVGQKQGRGRFLIMLVRKCTSVHEESGV